jgi:hypothetical protein
MEAEAGVRFDARVVAALKQVAGAKAGSVARRDHASKLLEAV